MGVFDQTFDTKEAGETLEDARESTFLSKEGIYHAEVVAVTFSEEDVHPATINIELVTHASNHGGDVGKSFTHTLWVTNKKGEMQDSKNARKAQTNLAYVLRLISKQDIEEGKSVPFADFDRAVGTHCILNLKNRKWTDRETKEVKSRISVPFENGIFRIEEREDPDSPVYNCVIDEDQYNRYLQLVEAENMEAAPF